MEPSIQAADFTPGCDPTKFGFTIFFFSKCSWKEYQNKMYVFTEKTACYIHIVRIFGYGEGYMSRKKKKLIWVGFGHERDWGALVNSG